MNRKNKRIVSLLIAAIMMMSLSGMAFAYEDEDVVVNPIGIPELPSACGDGCADHGHESVEFVGIEPANTCSSYSQHLFTGWSVTQAAIFAPETYCSMAVRYRHYRNCTKCSLTEEFFEFVGTLHRFVTSGNITVCNLCGYRK